MKPTTKSDWHPVFLLLCVTLLAFLFANVEIQIEGPNGWAGSLPTWRIERHWLLDVVFGGRPLTGYHLSVFAFMALMFHMPSLMHWRISLKIEARTISCLAFFWILEDYFWFLLNPAFGLARLTPDHAPWHKKWLLGLPSDYITFSIIAGMLYYYSFRTERGATDNSAGREASQHD
jgi:hypothetical protein